MTEHFASLTGAYVTNALDPAERAEFERHLAGCAACAGEVAGFAETTALLGAAMATEPPAALKQRVLAEIATTRQEPPQPETPAEPVITVLAHRRRWGTRIAVAATVVAVAAAGTFGVLVWRSEAELAEARRIVAEQQARSAAVEEMLRAPDIRTITATGSGGARGSTLISARLGKAMFLGEDFAAAPAGHTYQLWFIGSYGYRSPGLLPIGAGGRTSPLVAEVPPGTAGMGITVEPQGGSAQPTTQPVLQMTVPA